MNDGANGNEQALINKLKEDRYKPVYIWDAEQNEEDPDHQHNFDTMLVVLAGNITLNVNGKDRTLQTGDQLFIPRHQVHAAIAGPHGCRYIVAEKY